MFIIHKHEFQKGCLPDQVDCSLGVFDPWKLNQDAFLSLRDDFRLGDAELVDPVTYRFKALLDGELLYTFRLFFIDFKLERLPAVMYFR